MIHQGRAYDYPGMGKVIALETSAEPIVRCLVDVTEIWPRPEHIPAACLIPLPMRYHRNETPS